MKNQDGVYWNSNSQTILRRRRVIDRLEAQLLDGHKPSKEAPLLSVNLTQSDITRINAEIVTLKKRIF